jgi:hypothetical protein
MASLHSSKKKREYFLSCWRLPIAALWFRHSAVAGGEENATVLGL